MRGWRAGLLALAAMAPAPKLVPRRNFGLFPGAVITATARLILPGDTRLDPSTLPVPGPVDPEIDLRAMTWRAVPDAGGRRVDLRLTYQIFFSPQTMQRLAVPGITLGVLRHGRHADIDVAGFAVTVSPFRHDLTPSLDPRQMRPDAPLPAPSAPGFGPALPAGLILVVVSALGWGAARAWGGRRGAGNFAAAYRAMRRGRMDERTALLAVHRAFDAAAGRRVLAEDLDVFLSAHRQFLALRDEIAAFFAYSNHVFFGVGHAPPPASPRHLARALARAERLG